jgi:ribosomal-protein-alanine N-acetyltransferase
VQRVDDEMEILNLAVEPSERLKGIASRLVQQVLTGEPAKRPRRIFLEVRESNSAARAFYLAQGFVMNGRRRSYYSDPAEDALVLVRTAQ